MMLSQFLNMVSDALFIIAVPFAIAWLINNWNIKKMISLEGINQTYKIGLRNFLNSEMDTCIGRIERAEVKRSSYKRDVDGDAIRNLSGTILHYEGRVVEIQRTLSALDGEIPMQTSFVLDEPTQKQKDVLSDLLKDTNRVITSYMVDENMLVETENGIRKLNVEGRPIRK